MSSGAKRRQTMAKVARERLVKERRARKQERKDERKQQAAEAAEGATAEGDAELDETAGEPPATGDEEREER